MESLVKKIDKVMLIVFGIIGTAMILVASYNVFARDILRTSAPWTDEMLKLLDIWVIFVVSAIVFLHDEQISLTAGACALNRPSITALSFSSTFWPAC